MQDNVQIKEETIIFHEEEVEVEVKVEVEVEEDSQMIEDSIKVMIEEIIQDRNRNQDRNLDHHPQRELTSVLYLDQEADHHHQDLQKITREMHQHQGAEAPQERK